MAYKVKFPDGNQIVVNSLSEKIEYLCHKEYYEPFLVKGKISDNIEAWNVSIYKENNFIKIANAKEKLTELNKKHSSSKESNFDDNFYSRKRKNVEKLRDENFSKIQER